MRNDILERREEIELWISQLRPKAHICLELNCRPSTLDSYLRKFGLYYKGNMGSKGYKISPHKKATSDFLFKGSTISSHKLKIRLLKDNFKQRVREM